MENIENIIISIFYILGNINKRDKTENMTEFFRNDTEDMNDSTVIISPKDLGHLDEILTNSYYVVYVAFLAFSFLVMVIAGIFVTDCILLIIHQWCTGRKNNSTDKIPDNNERKTQIFPCSNVGNEGKQEMAVQLVQ